MEEQKKEMQKQMQEMRDRTHGNGMCKCNTELSHLYSAVHLYFSTRLMGIHIYHEP